MIVPQQSYFILDGVSSKRFGLVIDGSGTYGSARRSITRTSVPGRNGSITTDNGYYEDVDFTITGGIVEHMKENLSALEDFLSTHASNWYRMELTHHPEEFVLAQFDDLSPTITRDSLAEVDLNFTRKPQRFLKSGEKAVTVSPGQSAVLFNPTWQHAKPLIRVTSGTGSITIGDVTLTLSTNTGGTVIDFETEDCYEGTTDRRDDLTISADTLPTLAPGDNTVTAGEGVTFEIVPRWFRI